MKKSRSRRENQMLPNSQLSSHERYALRIVAQLESMRNDPDEWSSYVEECEMFGGYGRLSPVDLHQVRETIREMFGF
jgi:hypothetical protein